MNRNLRHASLVVASIVIGALVLSVVPALADTAGVQQDSWGRLFRYAGCALGVAAATSGLGVAAAIMMCLHVMVIDF